MRARKLDNFKAWRDQMKAEGKIKSSYEPFEQNGDLAELIGVVLGDGHICAHARCESLRIVGSGNNFSFRDRYALIMETVFQKKPHVTKRSKEDAFNITIYEKHISSRLGIPTGPRHLHEYVLPDWIHGNRPHIIRFLRGLYEAEGSIHHHASTYTYKLIFSNRNQSLLNIVFSYIRELGFHPHRSLYKIQVSKRDEVQKLADLLQFRHYSS